MPNHHSWPCLLQVASKWGARVFYGDALVYLSRIVYHLQRDFPIACWSELVPLMLQNLLCFVIVRRSRANEPEHGPDE